MTPQTRHIIRHETLAQLMPNAYLINIARGGHVNEADLISALNAGLLAGASLDVCEHEPAGAEHPFWNHPKIELTPHIAANTLRDESIAQILANIKAHQRGEPMVGVVKLAEGY
jgi:glyoxylate/hydroxypyruvate reductase A